MAMAVQVSEATSSTDTNNIMDPDIWGNLQHYIDLERLFVNLQLRDFFRSRSVCKDWNRVASNREFLERSLKDRPIRNPYFFLEVGSGLNLLSVSANQSASSSSALIWSTRRWPEDCLAVLQGLVCYRVPWTGQLRVFNLHTRVWTALPPSPQANLTYKRFHGMSVDVSVRPYAWKIVQGSKDVGTQIYDSRTNVWTIRPNSQMDALGVDHNIWRSKQGGVACSNGVVHIQMCGGDILSYFLESDLWKRIKLPPTSPGHHLIPGIGAWLGCVFMVSNYVSDECRIVVWQLVDVEVKQEWREFSSMPGELCDWLNSTLGDPANHSNVSIRASFCNEFILVYASLRHRSDGKGERFVLLNLATKAWEKVQLSSGAEDHRRKRPPRLELFN